MFGNVILQGPFDFNRDVLVELIQNYAELERHAQSIYK